MSDEDATDTSFDEPAGWRSPVVITVVSALLLGGLVLADLLIDPTVAVLTVFFALAPLLAASVLGPVPTSAFALGAIACAAIAGVWNDDGNQYWVRLIDVALVGTLSVLVSATRVRRENALRTSQRIASVAQQALLPVLPARIGPIQFGTRYHSATRSAQIGGDFFDFVADRGRVRLILGDVSGKGIDAVAQAARVIRAFRQYGASETDLLGVTRRIDEYVRPFWNWEFYATAVLVEFSDPDHLTIVSAGHPSPLHLSSGVVTELSVHPCVPLGLGPAEAMTRHTWRAKDKLLLYTDGLIEARDSSGAFLPRAQIDEALNRPALDECLDAIVAKVRAHAGRFSDDLALLLMANTPVTEESVPQGGNVGDEVADHAVPVGMPPSR